MTDKNRVIQFGSWTEGMDADPSVLDRTADKIETAMQIASIFRGQGDEWPYPNDEKLGENRTLLVSWHLSDFADYASWVKGEGDTLLREQAARVRDYGKPVVIRLWAEMNADWVDFQPTGIFNSSKEKGGSYKDFINAWQRVVNVFRMEGADNAKWAFNPTTDTYPETTQVKNIYPGDEYVDYLALDGYNWGEGSGLNWRSFSDVYWRQYENLASLSPSKPVWICEVGSADTTSGSDSEAKIIAPDEESKGKWWMDAFSDIKNDYTNIEAIVFFDAEKERDWRLDSSDAALVGLRRAIKYLNS